jgi:hypothetical protein
VKNAVVQTAYWANQAGQWFYCVTWVWKSRTKSETMGPYPSKDAALSSMEAYIMCVKRICRPWYGKLWHWFVGA